MVSPGASRTRFITSAIAAVSLISYICVLIANTELFAESKQQGADASWSQHVISGLIFSLPSLSAVVLSTRSQKAGASIVLATIGLLLTGASWIGMRA